MRKEVIIGAASVSMIAIILISVFVLNQAPKSIEVEDVIEKEARPSEEITPEIQEKLDSIEKTADENQYKPKEREWITSGPFQIDRSQYILGEKIFLVIGGLSYDEKGQVAFLRPLNSTHYSVYQTIPFDGAKKDAFNYYISPNLSASKELCSKADIVGNWTVVFRGTDYPNINFEIIDQILPGDEDDYNYPVC